MILAVLSDLPCFEDHVCSAAMDDPFGMLDLPAPVQPGQPLTELHGIAAQHKLHDLAQGVTVVTTTVDHAGRETVTTKQLAPDRAAAQLIAAKFDPSWQGSGGSVGLALTVNVLGNTASIIAHRNAAQKTVSTVLPRQIEAGVDSRQDGAG